MAHKTAYLMKRKLLSIIIFLILSNRVGADILFDDSKTDFGVALNLGFLMQYNLGPASSMYTGSIKNSKEVLHIVAHGKSNACAKLDPTKFAGILLDQKLAEDGATVVFHSCSVGKSNFLDDLSKILKDKGYTNLTLFGAKDEYYVAPKDGPAPYYGSVFKSFSINNCNLVRGLIKDEINTKYKYFDLERKFVEMKNDDGNLSYVDWAEKILENNNVVAANKVAYSRLKNEKCFMKDDSGWKIVTTKTK